MLSYFGLKTFPYEISVTNCKNNKIFESFFKSKKNVAIFRSCYNQREYFKYYTNIYTESKFNYSKILEIVESKKLKMLHWNPF